MIAASRQVPRPGMFAIVRNRRGVVASVEPADDTRNGRIHLVHLEYKDGHYPYEERLVWELEPAGKLLDRTPCPPRPAIRCQPTTSTRWSALRDGPRPRRIIDPDGRGPIERLPISSPFHGAVQVEDFQLVPLLKALAMPRVNL